MQLTKTDSEIEQWVLRELRSQDLGSSEICVECKEGIVTLGGSVPGIANKLAAAAAVDRVPGITGVVNDLKIDSLEVSGSPATAQPSKKFRNAPLVHRKRNAHRSAKGATP